VPLVKHLLGAAFLTDDSPTDARYQKKEYANCTLIDKPGSVFLHPERISGGSVGLFEGKKLGRAKNLEILDKETGQLEKEIDELRQDLESTDLELQLLRSDEAELAVEEVRKAVYTSRQALGESTTILERLVASKDQIIQRQTSSAATVEKLMQEMQATESMVSDLKEKMHSGSALWKDADAAYGTLMNAFSEASAAYNESHLEFVQHMSMVENLESEIRFRSHQVEELQTQIASDKMQSKTDLQSIGEIQGQIEQISSELIDHYAAKKTQEADLSGAEQQYFEMRNEIQVLEDKMRSITREKQNSQFLISQLNEEHQNIRFKLTSVSERLQIEFNTRLEDINIDEHTGLELEELELKVDKLRNRIENYGEINPMAMQAYEEMKERFTTINDQKIDILEAKESLLETIREIEDTATAKYTEAFREVREYFIAVFRSLFTEDDSCDLLLDDPANPLESDIQIVAKPKGKRPKSLSQLSGGEKTLTATALLFALYLLKPAPFCVFDEVDAPLDDANILKFNKIVKNFSAQSQFVIVTHNKQTMAAVDIIYGVYMEEQGISRLSPVDFRFLENTHVEELASV
jgi:chromosome segregation protein